MRGEVWVRTIVLAGLVRALTCGYGGGGGMQSRWKPTPSRLSSGGVSRVRAETLPPLAQFRGWAVPLDAPARLA